MKRTSLMICALTLGLGLSACDDTPLTGIASLGKTFTQAFGQGLNDTPLDISAADLNLRQTGEPFEL